MMTAFVSSMIACTVCFGDPNSDMTKAVLMAVFFLGTVISSVLVSIAWIAFTWAKRAKELEKSFPV